MELEVNIMSPVFNSLLNNVDKEIKRCVGLVLDHNFEGAEISIKLNIEIPEAIKDVPVLNEEGELTNFSYKYRKPHFNHRVTSTLKKQYKKEGGYSEDKMILFRDGEYIVAPVIKEEQISILDMENS